MKEIILKENFRKLLNLSILIEWLNWFQAILNFRTIVGDLWVALPFNKLKIKF